MKFGLSVKRLFAPLLDLGATLLGWLLLAPLTFLVPRRPELALFHGRDGGQYIDNCKHLFARASRLQGPDLVPVFLARDRALRDRLRAHGVRAELLRGPKGLWLWLRAGTIVVDSIDWPRWGRYPASRGARIIQLWHGIPLKYVQLALFRKRLARLPRLAGLALRLQRAITGRFAHAALFLSTSPFVTGQAFAKSFRYGVVSHAGYPRNDVLLARGDPLSEMGTDEQARAAIQAHRLLGAAGPVGLYAPTFRHSFDDPFAPGGLDLEALSHAAISNGVLLLVKFHPWMHGRAKSHALAGIHFVAPDSDAYPLMREVDFLVTDYSSIYFDFLLLDRPLLFFPYDLARYLASERSMYFDYDEMTPGPKATSVEELAVQFARLRDGADTWQAERARIRDLVFTHQDGGAAERLCREIFPGTSATQGTPTCHDARAEEPVA